MIVPSNRLLAAAAVVVLPFATVAGAIPAAAPVAIAVIGAVIVAVLIDAAGALGRLDGIAAELPEAVRLTKEREGTIAIRITNERMRPARLRLGIALPRPFDSPQETLATVLPAGAVHSTLEWPCTPGRRGNYLLERVFFETPSPMGFWAMRGVSRCRSELRVYPNLFLDRRYLAALFLNRGTFGIHAQRQVGKGREFEKLREYIPGDSYDEIHWKATAKRGHPVTKVFQIERTQEVYVIVDASRLSARFPEQNAAPTDASGGGRPTYLERFITASLVMGLAAEQQGDRFGVLVFDDQVRRFVPAGSGKTHYGTCRDAIYTLEPRTVNPDFDELFTFIRLRLRRRALLVFLTSLDDPVLAESFTHNMELIRRQHLILVNMMSPSGVQPLFSSGAVSSVSDVYAHLAGHLQWHDLRELERVLHRRGVTFSLLNNERMCVQLVSQYINVKQRQLL